MAAFTEIALEQYSDFQTTITLDDNQGDAIDLTLYTVSSRIKRSPYSSIYYSFNASITDNANGVISLSMTSANTANIPPNRYLYDVLITGEGNNIRVAEGIVTVTPGITNPND